MKLHYARMWQSTFLPTYRITDIFSFKTTAIICQVTWSALFKNELLWHSSNSFVTIICDHARWSLTGNRKQKNMSNFWPKKWSQSFKKFTQWSLTREILKQCLTEKQKDVKWPLTGGGRLREVVAMRELTVVVTYWSLLLLGHEILITTFKEF